MNVLPHVSRKMALWRFPEVDDFNHSGFEYGITKTVVSVESAYQKSGLPQIEDLLRQQH